ncbi:MAG: hypothetical protein QW035_02300 [Candidatus Anstonellales archaeon]
MGRGKERLLTCDSCGRQVPRDKAVEYIKGASVGGSELAESIIVSPKKVYYCVSCGKHRKIFEKKKEAAARRRERWL